MQNNTMKMSALYFILIIQLKAAIPPIQKQFSDVHRVRKNDNTTLHILLIKTG